MFQVPAGVPADQWGVRSTAAAGTAVVSLGAVVFGAAPTYAADVGGRLLVGFGASVLFVATLRFCANWFEPDEFGTMTGVTFTVGILGGLTASTLLAVAVAAVGWRPAMAGLRGFGFAVAAGIAPVSHNSPAAAGLPFLSRVLRGGLPLAYTVIKERRPGGASGTVIGMVNTFGWLGAVVFPVVSGVVLDAFRTGETLDGTRLPTATGYRVAFAVAAGAGLLATVCAVWLHRRHAAGGPTPAERAAADGTV